MSDENRKSTMGETLTQLRKANNYTQEQVAGALQIKRSTYAYYEKNITPTLENIKNLAKMFNVSTHFLMYGETEDYNFNFTTSSGAFGSDLGVWGTGVKPTIYSAIIKQSTELKEDEVQLLLQFRCLPKEAKAKIIKEVSEAYNKEQQ